MPRSPDLAIFVLTTDDRQTDKTDCFTPYCACARGVIMLRYPGIAQPDGPLHNRMTPCALARGGYSCQICERRGRDKAENKSARENLVTTPTLGRPHPLLGDRVLPRPLNIEIYGPKFDSILSLCLCHTPICAIELDSGTMLQNQANRDIGPNIGTVPAKPGHLATMGRVTTRTCVRIKFYITIWVGLAPACALYKPRRKCGLNIYELRAKSFTQSLILHTWRS